MTNPVTNPVIDLDELDRAEDELIDRFRTNPVLTGVGDLDDDAFLEILLQRRFVSLAFTPCYDLAIDLLADKEALQIARIILREEYPDGSGRTRSHREDMVEDLLRLGATREQITHSRPSRRTMRTITDTFRMIADAGTGEHPDAAILTVLRFWGEVLVAEEYHLLWPRMEDRMLTPDGDNLSRFYFPHLVHDAKDRPLSRPSRLAATHSDRLASRLRALLVGEEQRDLFLAAERRILAIREGFYRQFA